MPDRRDWVRSQRGAQVAERNALEISARQAGAGECEIVAEIVRKRGEGLGDATVREPADLYTVRVNDGVDHVKVSHRNKAP